MAPGRELGGGGEVDAVPGLDHGPAERDGQDGLADPGWPDEQDVGGVVEEPQGGQIADEPLINTGLGREIEVVQGPGLRQAGEPEPGCQPAGFGGLDLDLQQSFQGRGQRHPFGAGLLRQAHRPGLEQPAEASNLCPSLRVQDQGLPPSATLHRPAADRPRSISGTSGGGHVHPYVPEGCPVTARCRRRQGVLRAGRQWAA